MNPPVFVLSVFDTGLAVLRLLAERGIWVEGFDHVAENAGFATRRATTHFVPEPENATEGLLPQIARRVEALNRGKAVLIPASDYYVQWICDHADELARYAIWLLPPVPTTRLILTTNGDISVAMHGAGEVVRTFSEFVTGGSLAVCSGASPGSEAEPSVSAWSLPEKISIPCSWNCLRQERTRPNDNPTS